MCLHLTSASPSHGSQQPTRSLKVPCGSAVPGKQRTNICYLESKWPRSESQIPVMDHNGHVHHLIFDCAWSISTVSIDFVHRCRNRSRDLGSSRAQRDNPPDVPSEHNHKKTINLTVKMTVFRPSTKKTRRFFSRPPFGERYKRIQKKSASPQVQKMGSEDEHQVR